MPIILIVSFAVLNLLIVVVVDSMQQVHKEEAAELMRDVDEIALREAGALHAGIRDLKEDSGPARLTAATRERRVQGLESRSCMICYDYSMSSGFTRLGASTK